MLRDSYGAEYGKRPGAQVLIVTQSGTNAFHGSLYEFLRNSAFDARNFFDPASVPGFQRNQFGTPLGGPIQKDKTFVFGNFEGLQQHLHQTGVDLVPDTQHAQWISAVRAGQPRAESLPRHRIGVRRRFAADQSRGPRPLPARRISAESRRRFNSPLQTIRDDFGTLRLDHNFSQKDFLNGGLHHRRQRGLHSHQHQCVQRGCGDPARTGGEPTGDARFFADRAEHGSRRIFARRLLLYRGADARTRPPRALPGFLAGDPLGALVVGGSAASNPTAQFGLAGSQ